VPEITGLEGEEEETTRRRRGLGDERERVVSAFIASASRSGGEEKEIAKGGPQLDKKKQGKV